MSASPAISCVMAAYNAERYLELAVSSILDQTLRDFEFIIVDDGSHDRTPAILEQLAATDSRIRIVRQENIGLTRALNVGAALARGEYIARMDADDVAEPTRFALQAEYLKSHSDCVAVGCSLRLIDPDGDVIAEQTVPLTHDEIVAELLKGNGAIPHPSAMFRRSAFDEIGGYREEFTAAQDLDLWLRMSESGKLANLDSIGLRYRLHADSVTTQRRAVQLACAERAVREALRRRGDPLAENFCLTQKPMSRARTLRSWSRMALKAQQFPVARKHAWSAFRLSPFSPAHWVLLAKTIR